MKKLILLFGLLICITAGYSQEAKEYATLATNMNYRKKAFIVYADKTTEFESKEKKPITTQDLMGILNNLSEEGWEVINSYATSVGVTYLLQREKQ